MYIAYVNIFIYVWMPTYEDDDDYDDAYFAVNLNFSFNS